VAQEKLSPAREPETALAAPLTHMLDSDGFPPDAAWDSASPISFAHDWQGHHADPLRETQVRVLWSPQTLFLRFQARYRTITVFEDAEPSGRRDQLWERDVAEVFLQPPELHGSNYKEFEVSPNGFWIDLDIAPGGKRFLQSGLRRRVHVAAASNTWDAQLAIPLASLTANFDPAKAWRVNFYRVEGAVEPRFYSAWSATRTTVPNFHVPEAFGRLLFRP
jgi:alpha-galactosidase